MASHFCALTVLIRSLGDSVGADGFGEAGPAGPGIVFVFGRKQRFATNRIDINSVFVVIKIFVFKRILSVVLDEDFKLLIGQSLFELFVGRNFAFGGVPSLGMKAKKGGEEKDDGEFNVCGFHSKIVSEKQS